MIVTNLFTPPPDDRSREFIEALLEEPGFRLERIVSTGHASPPGYWYDQDRNEWVVLLSGEAALLFDGEREATVLRPGDAVLIPAHCRHRVEWTAAGTETVWLALHFAARTGASHPQNS